MKRERAKPPANTSPEAIALRQAATAFAAYDRTRDGDGHKLNIALLKAAVAYARKGDTLYRRAGLVMSEMDRGIGDGSIERHGWYEWLEENDVRAIVCELLGHKTPCGDTDLCLERQEAES